MANNLLDESKKYLVNFYNGGEWVDKPSLRVFNHEVSEESIEFLSEFFRFLIDSKFLSMYGKMWLKSNLKSVNEMVSVHNEMAMSVDIINFNTASSNINYDKKKLSKYFDNGMLKNIMLYPEKFMENYRVVLVELVRKYFDDSMYTSKLGVKFPRDLVVTEIDEESWEKLRLLLEFYSKENMKKISRGEKMTDLIGYFNYLVSSYRLDSEEQLRLKEIKRILGIV